MAVLVLFRASESDVHIVSGAGAVSTHSVSSEPGGRIKTPTPAKTPSPETNNRIVRTHVRQLGGEGVSLAGDEEANSRVGPGFSLGRRFSPSRHNKVPREGKPDLILAPVHTLSVKSAL